MCFSCAGTEKLILKFICKGKEPTKAKIILKKKIKVVGITLLNIKANSIAMVTKNIWYWWRDAQINQQNRIKNTVRFI